MNVFLRAGWIAGIAALLPWQNALAAEIEEVMVTAQRRSEDIQDVPAAVTAVSGEALERRNIEDISGLGALAPNLQVAQPFGPGSPPNFTMRGISSTDFSQNQSRPVAFYIDEGIRQLSSLESMPLYDIERVEILRGPQGTLYGKNATGGAVNVITKKPGFETEGYQSVGYGNFNRSELEGAAQTALVDDRIAARLAYTYAHDDGTIRNRFPGEKDQARTDQFAVRGTLLLKPRENFEAILRLNHYRIKGGGSPVLATDIDLAGAGYPELAAVPGANREGLGFFDNNASPSGTRDLENTGANLLLNLDFANGYRLTSVSTFDSGSWAEQIDAEGLPISQEVDTLSSRGIDQLVQELRLASDPKAALRWLGGIFYSHDRSTTFAQYAFLIDPRCASCDFDLGGGGTGFIQSNEFVQKRDSYAAYFKADLDFSDALTASAGVRYSYDELGVEDYQASLGDTGDPFAIETISPLDDSTHFDNVSVEATLNWRANDGLLVYGTFKQGYRTGAYNGQAFSSPDEVNVVEPEEADNFEAGFKSELLGRALIVNAAAFYTKYTNQQVISAEDNLFPLRSVERSRIYGVELESTIRASSALTASLGVGWLDTEYTRGNVGGVDVSGNRLTNAAEWNVNVAADWTIATLGSGSINLHGDAAYVSSVFYDVLNTPGIGDDGHWLANAQLSYDADRWSFALWGTNISNSEYIAYSLDQSDIGYRYSLRGTPRQYGARATFRF